MLELDARDKNRLAQSSITAAAIWLVIIVLLAIIPGVRNTPEERTFPEVRITLNQDESVPVETRPAAPAAAGTTERDTMLEPSESAEAVPAPRTSRPAKPTREPTQQTSKQPSSGLGIPDFQTTAGNETPASSGEYLDFSSDSPREQTIRDPAPVLREFEGSAARVDEPATRPGNADVEGGNRVSAASDETLRALDRIQTGSEGGIAVPEESASPSQAAGRGTVTTAADPTAAARTPGMVGPITFEGSFRRLIYPEDPAIILPPHLARLIDSDRSVTVLFVVRADGSVPASLIRFTPSALLPPEIQNYLKNEFSIWRFERGNDDGQARFLYSIKVQ